MTPETTFDLTNVDVDLLGKAMEELSTVDSGNCVDYPPSCEKGGMWET